MLKAKKMTPKEKDNKNKKTKLQHSNTAFLSKYIEKMDAKQNRHFPELITSLRGNKKVLVQVQNLRKHFGKKEVLKGINFQIREGEHIALLGANGAGKTTTVEILCGLNKQSSGKINYLYQYNKSFLEKIGIQFQESSYPNGIKVRHIVNFIIEIFKTNISKQRLKNLIKVFGIDEYYNKKAKSLSGGEQQRLNALLAIVHNPKIIFLDEISTGLDIAIKSRIKAFIKDYLKETKSTLILISHDMEEVEYLTERIILLNKGKIVVSAYKDEIIATHGTITKFINRYID